MSVVFTNICTIKLLFSFALYQKGKEKEACQTKKLKRLKTV